MRAFQIETLPPLKTALPVFAGSTSPLHGQRVRSRSGSPRGRDRPHAAKAAPAVDEGRDIRVRGRPFGVRVQQTAEYRRDAFALKRSTTGRNHHPRAPASRKGSTPNRSRRIRFACARPHVTRVRLLPNTEKIAVKALVVRKLPLFNKLNRLRRISDITITSSAIRLPRLPFYLFTFITNNYYVRYITYGFKSTRQKQNWDHPVAASRSGSRRPVLICRPLRKKFTSFHRSNSE